MERSQGLYQNTHVNFGVAIWLRQSFHTMGVLLVLRMKNIFGRAASFLAVDQKFKINVRVLLILMSPVNSQRHALALTDILVSF